MKRSTCLSLAALSAALLLGASASAHDPKEFDGLLDAAAAKAAPSACATLGAMTHSKSKAALAEIKAQRARCDAEKMAAAKAAPVAPKPPAIN